MPRHVGYDHATVAFYVEAFRSLLKIPVIFRIMRLGDGGKTILKMITSNSSLSSSLKQRDKLSHSFESLFITDCTAADSDIFGPNTVPQSFPFRLKSIPINIIDRGRNSPVRETIGGLSHSIGDLIIFHCGLVGIFSICA